MISTKLPILLWFELRRLNSAFKDVDRKMDYPIEACTSSRQHTLLSTSTSGQAFSLVSESTLCPIVQNATLNTWDKKVNYDVEQIFKIKDVPRSIEHNLSREEITALESLSKNDEIVNKNADKGGAQR